MACAALVSVSARLGDEVVRKQGAEMHHATEVSTDLLLALGPRSHRVSSMVRVRLSLHAGGVDENIDRGMRRRDSLEQLLA